MLTQPKTSAGRHTSEQGSKWAFRLAMTSRLFDHIEPHLRSHKTAKKKARSARLAKHPFWSFGPTIRELKLFSLLPPCLCWRAQRAKILCSLFPFQIFRLERCQRAGLPPDGRRFWPLNYYKFCYDLFKYCPHIICKFESGEVQNINCGLGL